MADRRYTKTHEWVTVDGREATIGITDFAQSQLGDVVFLELPSAGRKLAARETFGVIESVKAASDLYSPVAGRISAVNDKLSGKPELVNSDPYGDGWILKLELAGDPPSDLLDHSPEDRMAMLEAIGVESMNDLLVDIPQSLRLESRQLPNGLSELETMAQVSALAGRNRVYADRLTFRGGGMYRRFIPAAVAAVTSKPEFYTAYTPYQAEASQGTLQAIFEYQTLIAELTGMDVSNASLYDGATAVAEAAMMAHVQTGRSEVLVSGYLHPEYVQVLRAFGEGRGIKVRRGDQPGKKTAAVIFQQRVVRAGRLRHGIGVQGVEQFQQAALLLPCRGEPTGLRRWRARDRLRRPDQPRDPCCPG